MWREFIKDLKGEWDCLWRNRREDKIKAESIANSDFPRLFVEKGMVIMATKDYRPPVFHEILEKYVPKNIRDHVNLSPAVGGIRKFIRDKIKKQRVPVESPRKKTKKKSGRQQKHGGRGWLHRNF